MQCEKLLNYGSLSGNCQKIADIHLLLFLITQIKTKQLNLIVNFNSLKKSQKYSSEFFYLRVKCKLNMWTKEFEGIN